MYPSEQRHHKNRSDGIRGDSGRRFLLRAYITLFGGHNRTPPTLHYHHHLSTHHQSFPCLQIIFFEPSEQHHSKNCLRRKRGDSGRCFLLRVYNAVWWTQSYSPNPPQPPAPIHSISLFLPA